MNFSLSIVNRLNARVLIVIPGLIDHLGQKWATKTGLVGLLIIVHKKTSYSYKATTDIVRK